MQRWGSEARPTSLLLQPDCRPAAVYCCTYDSVVTDMQRNDANDLHFMLTIPEPFMKLYTIQTRVIYILFYTSLISLKTLKATEERKCFHFRGKYFCERSWSDVKSVAAAESWKLLLQLKAVAAAAIKLSFFIRTLAGSVWMNCFSLGFFQHKLPV